MKYVILLSSIACAALLACGAGVSSWRSGAVLERSLRSQVQQWNTEGSLRITGLEHRRGWLQSSGHFRIQLADNCTGAPSAAAAPAEGLLVEYQASQWPRLSGPLRLEARLHLPASVLETLQLASGDDVLLHASLQVAWMGALQARFDSTALNMPIGEAAAVRLAATSGSWLQDGRTRQLDWSLSDLRWISSLGNATLKDLHVHSLGTPLLQDGDSSRSEFRVGHVTLAGAELSQLVLDAAILRHEGVIDARLGYRTASLQHPALSMQQVALSYDVGGLDANALGQLRTRLNDNCAVLHPDAASLQLLQDTFHRLLARGVTQALTLAAQLPDGKLDAGIDLQLQIPPGALQADLPLAQMLSVRGHLEAADALIRHSGVQNFLPDGLLVQVSDGQRVAFSYRGGKLEWNGKPADPGAANGPAPFVAAALSGAQQGFMGALRAWFADAAESAPEAVAEAAPAAAPDAPAQPAALPAATLAAATASVSH